MKNSLGQTLGLLMLSENGAFIMICGSVYKAIKDPRRRMYLEVNTPVVTPLLMSS